MSQTLANETTPFTTATAESRQLSLRETLAVLRGRWTLAALWLRVVGLSKWPELAAAFVAIGGVAIGVLSGFHPREWQASGSDLKTLYASAVCFRQYITPYSFDNIARVFQANRVVPPTSWYAHAPVYPPFTLAMLVPLTALPMTSAVYAWLAVSSCLWALAAFYLAQLAGEIFLLKRPWRMLLIALFAASPLLSFGLEMCNVSGIVAALCIIAVARREQLGSVSFLNAAALCVGLLLKPHLALWVVAALLFSRVRPDRVMAVRALAMFGGALFWVALWMAAHHQLVDGIAAYLNVVSGEVARGSMNPANHELMAVAAQITSIRSLFGYAMHGVALDVLSSAVLLTLIGVLIFVSWQDTGRRGSTRMLRIAAWSAVGLVATYHRAHDAAFLAVVLPYVLARLRTCRRDPFAWAFVALYALSGFGPRWETFWWMAAKPGLWHVSNFVLYRQSTLTVLLLAVLLLAETLRAIRRQHPARAAMNLPAAIAVAA